jgi:transposase-like protein
MASVFDMIDIVLTIAAALCVQSVFTARAQRDYDASTLRKSLESDHGDPMTLLNAYDEWVSKKAEGADSRKWCRRRGLEEQRFYEITKLKQQFHSLLAEHGLLRRANDENTTDGAADVGLTPVERREKHAHRRQLAQLRREQQRNTKKRKVLKMEDADWNIASDEDNDNTHADMDDGDVDSNIRDLEFRLTNEIDQLQQQANDSRRMSLKDMTLLKVILCSGLFPQVAIADEYNSFKRDSDQVFHTRNKGFVLLHPTSVFSTNPEPLQLRESQIKESNGNAGVRRGPSNRGQLSNGHQLVAFVSLVETTKPYLVGALRVPALQTLLLFSQAIDTNADCSRIVCDGWLEVVFENGEDGESSLSSAVKLRTVWQQLLQQKLKSSGGRRRGVTEGDAESRRRAEHTQRALHTKLAEFLHIDIYYYIRRIHAAEQSHLYRGNAETCSDDAQVTDRLAALVSGGGEPHPVKGGRIVGGGFIVYDCLQDDDTSSVWGEYTTCMQRHWTCPHCDCSLIVTIGERLEHEQQCEQKKLQESADAFMREADEQVQQSRVNALRKPYRCPLCEQKFSFTTAEALKHKKLCGGDGMSAERNVLDNS